MDHQFTKQIQAWLNAKHESDADIKRGADILFRLNRDRFYHARATRQPQAYRSNIEYELGKFLKIRLAGMTIEEVKQMNATVIPEAQAIISEGAPALRPKKRPRRPIPSRKKPTMTMLGFHPPRAMVSQSSARASAKTMTSCPKRWLLSGISTPSDTRR